MKTLMLALAVSLALSFGFAQRGAAQTIAFQVSNQQAEALGQVTISTQGGNYYLNVAGSETDTTQIADTATSVTINGQTVPQGQKAILQLATGKFVEVIWTSPNEIDVFNEGIPG